MNWALVTGGSRGIGREICAKLASMGYNVLINYKGNKEKAEETRQIVKNAGVYGELIPFDVADRQQVQDVLGKWIENNGDKIIEVLVNNAGIKDDVLLMWMKDEQWDNVLNTSLGGFFNVTKILVNSMLRQRYGRIINVVSLSGLKGLAGQTNYSAAKGGMIAATKALAQEVGKRNITVNAVAPGFIKTDMTAGINEAEMKQLIPANRFGTPEEVAHVVGFLATKEAAYVTGQVISVNGGLYT
ncbi:MAG: 3-oxoacyl-ACP reductase FabG [Sphingobacteriales bacterium]|jgi:3-oxoacyl-[acyl-carrier protein] reductase|nr:3-oxoacyl-ACP reductase FabG [Sphingobacteriales bacterium]